jgi:hypothetical protein
MRPAAIAILLLLSGCDGATATTKPGSDTSDATWEELSEDEVFGSDTGKEEGDDTGKDEGDDTGKDDGDTCGDEVVEGEPCDGDWTDTLCEGETGEWWWCEDGVWTSDKDE